MRVLDPRGKVGALVDDVCLSEALRDIADFPVQLDQDIAHRVVHEWVVGAMQLRRADLHRLLGIENRWQ